LWKKLEREVSGAAALHTVADVARHHRIQASPGYRSAAEGIHDRLVEAGLDVRTLSFPADTSSAFWGASSFQEWEARSAMLDLIEPQEQAQRLADYRVQPLNLIARSLPFDGEAEVVVLEKGEDPADYEGLDVQGKLVLTRGNVRRVHDLTVVRRGALGILYDGMAEGDPVRPAWALPDAVQYTSFWWQEQEPLGFGFALTPRQGEKLRRLAKEHTLRVRAHIDARLYDGTFEVVEATLPGDTFEEIVLVAHLCHPQPSANDNASGAAALVEIARALRSLIDRGELDPPRRTLRFLWLPEMTGTYAYLAANEERIPRMVAGLNLDMVGQDQEQCGSSLLFEQPPGAFPNFTPALLARLRTLLLPEVKSFGGTGGYPLFRYAEVPFSGGSDHYIFADPTVGVPMPMIIQWPDRFYHTSDDTPDRVDPAMLGKVARLAAAYAYWLAQAGPPEAEWLTREMSARFRRQVIEELQDHLTEVDEEGGIGLEELEERLAYRIDRHRAALDSLQRLASIPLAEWKAEDEAFAQAELDRAIGAFPDEPRSRPEQIEGAERVVERCFRGPVTGGFYVSRLEAEARDRWWDFQQRTKKVPYPAWTLAEYWADGDRTIAEIARRVRLETGHEVTERLVEYFSLMAELGLLAVRS
jgi:hypothetical protein